MSQVFYPLLVSKTDEEIGGMAKTVMFDVPVELSNTFAWRAGQHLSIRFILNGQEVRRSYSISSSPVSGDPMQITVKRVEGGLVSNHVNDTIKKGDIVDVMPPFGSFCIDAMPNERRTHYFVGAGSGITPLYSMLHSIMCNEPHSVAYLAYGNKDADSILFAERLNKLTERYGKRIHVMHVLSASSLFASSKWTQFDYWRKGIVDAAAIEALINEKPPYAQNAQYYVCGPGSMNQSVKAALMSLDVPANRIHTESYGGAIVRDDLVEGITASADITLNGAVHDVSIASNQTVLDAVRKAGLSPPFSCQSGVCGACKATLLDGTVHMRARMALEDVEIDNGKILTCQSLATSETLSITYA